MWEGCEEPAGAQGPPAELPGGEVTREEAQAALAEVRALWGHLSEAEFASLVWNATCFPADTATMLQQLRDAHAEHGGDATSAIAAAHREMFDAHEQWKKERLRQLTG